MQADFPGCIIKTELMLTCLTSCCCICGQGVEQQTASDQDLLGLVPACTMSGEGQLIPRQVALYGDSAYP